MRLRVALVLLRAFDSPPRAEVQPGGRSAPSQYPGAFAVACVKFSNLATVFGWRGFGDLLASVAAVAEGRVDRLQLFEVELDNGLQLLG